jgi:hypothetical protein
MFALLFSERFWIDAMNVGVGLLVAVPVLLVLAVSLGECLKRG